MAVRRLGMAFVQVAWRLYISNGSPTRLSFVSISIICVQHGRKRGNEEGREQALKAAGLFLLFSWGLVYCSEFGTDTVDIARHVPLYYLLLYTLGTACIRRFHIIYFYDLKRVPMCTISVKPVAFWY